MKKIIVHGGRAHRDDFLAVGLVCAITNKLAPVYRRNPTAEELDDPKVWVLDVGGRFEPDLRNFDHHQLAGAEDCAFSLVARSFKTEEGVSYHELFETAPWYKALIRRDNLGREALGVSIDALDAVDIIEGYVLAAFGDTGGERFSVNNYWVMVTKDIATRKIKAAKDIVARLVEIEQHSEILPVQIKDSPADVLFAPTLTSFGTEAYLERKNINAIATVTLDDRNGGLCLYRVRYGTVLLDFRRVADHPKAVFVHRSGHMMTVQPDTKGAELAVLIERAAG